MVGRQAGRRHSGQRGRGYAYLHHALDDHSRLAYSEILGNERGSTAAAFWARARETLSTDADLPPDYQVRWIGLDDETTRQVIELIGLRDKTGTFTLP